MKKKHRVTVHPKQTLIDINGKRQITVKYDIPEISAAEYAVEMGKIDESVARIRKAHYSTNVALQRTLSSKLTPMQLRVSPGKIFLKK